MQIIPNMVVLKTLPEDCLYVILSLASPKDVTSFSQVSSFFNLIANQDVVWEKFLPSDYREIMRRAVYRPIEFSSMKQLYFRLCHQPLLIDDGHKSFSLERSSGKKCYMLSARQLSITWGDDPMSWAWISNSCPAPPPPPPHSNSRFKQTAYLRSMCWLGIKGSIRTNVLSPNTTYGAYLVIKINKNAFGLDSVPSETSMEVGDRVVSRGSVYLCHPDDGADGEAARPAKRQDGWLEVELGEVLVTGKEDEDVIINMSLMEIKSYRLKGGLLLQGIEIRPKIV